LIVLFAEPKPAERSHKKKKRAPVTDPAKTSLILFDEVDTFYSWQKHWAIGHSYSPKNGKHFTR